MGRKFNGAPLDRRTHLGYDYLDDSSGFNEQPGSEGEKSRTTKKIPGNKRRIKYKMNNSKYNMLKSFISFLLLFTISFYAHSQKPSKPNVLLIMMDDMGFSDLGFMGSEIQTPNIDRLAEGGVFVNQFYNTSRCCPSRASLLTGQYQHMTGMGWMTASDLGHPGYTGDLNNKCITIAQALKQNDYSCYMTGKWHLTHDSYMKKDASKHNWPLQRGFDRFYGHLSGGGGYFNTRTMLNDNTWLGEMPDDFYLTNAVTDSTLQILDDHFKNRGDKPFFFYMAYYAPHRPLHALQKDVAKYRGKFMAGWDKLREKNYKQLEKLGIINEACKLSERDSGVPEWDSLTEEEKKIWDARMAVYAAQIDCADQGIGKVIAKLEKNGELENTLILFLSDNGGTAEGQGGQLKLEQIGELGNQNPKQSYRRNWANVSNVPFRDYKADTHQGGIATPLIAHWPEKIQSKGGIVQQVGHIMDLFPTILEATGTAYPEKNNNTIINPLQGKSILSALVDCQTIQRESLFFEHEADRAVLYNNYKLVSKATRKPPYAGEWELYDLKNDCSETNDLAKHKPELVNKLSDLWDEWAKKNQVYPLDNSGWRNKIEADVHKQ